MEESSPGLTGSLKTLNRVMYTGGIRVLSGMRSGLKALMNITEHCQEMLPDVRIKDSAGKSLTIESFLNRIDKLKVRIPK